MLNLSDILDKFGIKYDQAPEYYRVLCPFHSDTNPSGNIHVKTSSFVCYACNKRTSLEGFLAKARGMTYAQVNLHLGIRSDCKHPLSITDIERDHIELWTPQAKHLLDALTTRQVEEEYIRRYRIGAHYTSRATNEIRISIPVTNEIGEYVLLRLYMPGAKERKFINKAAYGSAKIRFFPLDQLEYDQILICGGEIKALAAAQVLNKYDIGAIAPTCGENTLWDGILNNKLEGKLVYINTDIDDEEYKWAINRCKLVSSVARAIHHVKLPEMNIPKGDINDFIREGGDLYKLLIDSPEWKFIPGGVLKDDKPQEVNFRQAFSPTMTGKRAKFTGVVNGIMEHQYFLPAEVIVRCTRGEDYCITCDVNSQPLSTETKMTVHNEHQALLDFISTTDEYHNRVYKRCFNIPKNCHKCSFQRTKEYSVSIVRLEELTDPMSREEAYAHQIGYTVNAQVIENHPYIFTGRIYPSPKDQVASYVISNCEPTIDSLEAYIPESPDTFRMFEPDNDSLEALERKLDEIYSDLEANVTRVWKRRDLHIGIDLVYHSILSFKFMRDFPMHMYAQALIVGDTSQGKSEAISNLRRHYHLGDLVDCGNSSKAGLAIGIDKLGGKHFPVLGVLPKNDKKLVILEELKKMKQEDFQSLTEARSSGQVQTSKIARKISPARVRLIAVSNPPGGRKISSYTYGIECAINIIGTQEDLRRFDFVLVVGEDDIDISAEKLNPPTYPHKFDGELCQKLILKAWKCSEVVFENVQEMLEITSKLVEDFGYGMPILDPNSSHLKIAKLAAAIAARVHSYDKVNPGILVVKSAHVQFIDKYLRRIYTASSSKLGEKSKAVKLSHMLKNENELIKYLKSIPNARDIINKISETDILTAGFIKELVGDFILGSQLFSRLIQCNAIARSNGRDNYVKNPAFTKLLSENEFHVAPPDYLKQGKF